ncbi:hypothetical protein ADQ49_27325 [Salmonella enterica subsp. enterica]|nr:hypothetical protein [Salmonella enterica subsp. enterica serovar Enteritidis]
MPHLMRFALRLFRITLPRSGWRALRPPMPLPAMQMLMLNLRTYPREFQPVPPCPHWLLLLLRKPELQFRLCSHLTLIWLLHPYWHWPPLLPSVRLLQMYPPLLHMWWHPA